MEDTIGIIGAGLAGSMTAILLSNLGFTVYLFEKRSDPRKVTAEEIEKMNSSAFGTSTSAIKRSINLALSERGIAALKEIGLLDQVLKDSVKMTGRVIHTESGKVLRQQYGTKDHYLNSISRQGLNVLLLNELESTSVAPSISHARGRVKIFFGYSVIDACSDGKCSFMTDGGTTETFQFSLIIATDGAYSTVRELMLKRARIDYSRHFISHGYKELNIPPMVDEQGNSRFALKDYEGLHIWPRKKFMMIALPNADKSFTVTLFAPFKTDDSQGGFDSIDPNDPASITQHFVTNFPDVVPLIPDLCEDYRKNPIGSLITVKTNPWSQGRILLLGDAAHAVVPFFGQGMNAAFEDALVLYELMRHHTLKSAIFDVHRQSQTKLDYEFIASQFSEMRVPALNALADLCIDHYNDMASNTMSLTYLLTRRMQQWIQNFFPKSFMPLYTMISFTRIPYHRAIEIAKIQETVSKLALASLSVLFVCAAGFGLHAMKSYKKFL